MHNLVRSSPTQLLSLVSHSSSQNHLARATTAAEPSLVGDNSTAPIPSEVMTSTAPTATSTSTAHPTTTFEPAIPIAPSAAPAPIPPSHLSPAAIAGLCIGISILIVLAAYIALEVCVLRRRRRERALRRAVEEVESGSIRSDSVRSEVKSREGFVVDEKEIHDDDEIWGLEGRKGLSLPRRMW